MSKFGNLEGYSVKELRELKARIDIAIVHREKTERVEMRDKLAALAAEAGFTLDEILGGKRTRAGGGAAKVKYRNPENPEETWSGRGRMAGWLAEKLKKRGARKEDFAV